MNKLQEKLLEIAIEYIRVCEQLNLNYFAYGGTCLGAVRHKGFIPWDDDMDFIMPRKDYEILRKNAKKEFKPKYLLQCWEVDHNYPYTFAKLRDTTTTMICAQEQAFDINQGCWIDIFIMDEVPKEPDIIKRIEWKKKMFFRPRYFSKYYPFTLKHVPYIIFLHIIFPTKKIAFILDKKQFKNTGFKKNNYFWSNWNYVHSDIVCYEPFKHYTVFPFENIFIRVPQDFDSYLVETYGKWWLVPPVEERISHPIIKLIL